MSAITDGLFFIGQRKRSFVDRSTLHFAAPPNVIPHKVSVMPLER